MKPIAKSLRSFVHCTKGLFLTLTLLAAPTLFANSAVSTSKNLFLQRAFSANTTRELLMEGLVTKTDFDGFFSFFSFTGAYNRSWEQNETYGLGAFPLWSGTNSMTIGTNDGTSNLDAYQFGLGTVATPGSLTLNPVVYQGGSDFLLYFGSSINDPGMFIKLKAPLAVIGINPNLTEVPAQLGAFPNLQYPAGSIQPSSTNYADFATTMTQAFQGYLPGGQTGNGLAGDFIPMQFGLIDGTQKSGVQFGDIEMTLGYNFICDEDHTFGIGLRASAPSAHKSDGTYMLEAVLGRDGSWGIGGYLVGKMKLWENHTNQSLQFNIMSTILHLVTTNKAVRSYDLTANGAGSKYLLVADYNNNIYQGTIQNLINLSTLPTSSSFSAEGDVTIDLAYVSNGWQVAFGYNFWGRTSETLQINSMFPENRYAILGRQTVSQPGTTLNQNQVCQPSATMKESLGAYSGSGPMPEGIVSALTPANRISGNAAFDLVGAAQASAMTSKLFAKSSYSWLDSHLSPHIGLAGEFEISNAANNALPQWSVMLIGGLYF